MSRTPILEVETLCIIRYTNARLFGTGRGTRTLKTRILNPIRIPFRHTRINNFSDKHISDLYDSRPCANVLSLYLVL